MIFSIRTWKTDPFLLKLYFSYPKRWQRCALPSSEKVPFTSLFCSSIGTSMCVYPYAFMHICVINIQNMALSTSHEGNSFRNLPSALKFLLKSPVCTENRYPMQLKKSDSHAQTHPYTCIWISAINIFYILFLCHIRIWGKLPSTEIIITLFQEDNIFGTNASLTYGPQIQRHTCVW